MATGVPAHELVRRYRDYLHPHDDIPTEYLPMVRRAQVADYSGLQEDPRFREVSVPLEPVRLHRVEWSAPMARVTGGGAWLDFELPAEVYMAGIRLRYRCLDEGALPYVGIAWKAGHQALLAIPGRTRFRNTRPPAIAPTGSAEPGPTFAIPPPP